MAQKILVVDDDLFIREIYVELLQKAGYEVDSAQDGEEGLAKIKNGGYDLILLDQIMPKLDGLGVLNGLLTNPPKIANGPIIILSNNSAESTREEYLKMGASSFLVKADLNPQELLDKIKQILLN